MSPLLFITAAALLFVGSISSRPELSSFKSSQDAAILSDSRYYTTAGKFGSSVVQEDGVEFKEDADSEGNRKGFYSYVDPNGKKRTITYTAGLDGFNAAFGDHLPIPPAPQFPISSGPIFQSPVSFQLQSLISPNARALPESIQIQYQPVQSTTSSAPSPNTLTQTASPFSGVYESARSSPEAYNKLSFPLFGISPSSPSYHKTNGETNQYHQPIEGFPSIPSTSTFNGQDGITGSSTLGGHNGISSSSTLGGHNGISSSSTLRGHNGISGSSTFVGHNGISGSSTFVGHDGISGSSTFGGHDGISGLSTFGGLNIIPVSSSFGEHGGVASKSSLDDLHTSQTYHKIYPAGQLNLSQSPEGFSYTFKSIV